LQPIVDTHAHVFSRTLQFAHGRRYTPQYDATLDAYIGNLDTHGIDKGVLVQPSFLGTDNGYMLAAIARKPERLRGVAVLEPGTSNKVFQALSRQGVVGLRYNLVGRDPGLPLEPHYRDLTRTAVRHDWHVEVHVPARHLPPLLDDFGELGATVVVDHFGLPGPDCSVGDPGFQDLLKRGKASEAPVFCKLSAPYRQGGGPVTDYALALLDALGPDRLLWGSDWPWTQHETAHRFDQCAEWLDVWTQSDTAAQRAIAEASLRLFRFK